MHFLPGMCLRTTEDFEKEGMDSVEMDEAICDYRDDPEANLPSNVDPGPAEANPDADGIPMTPIAMREDHES
jgi:hypothetical protein